MKNIIVSIIFATIGCAKVTVDLAGVDTSCTVEADCSLTSVEDICGGCLDTSISASETERVGAMVEEAGQWCVFGIAECFIAITPSCQDGQCQAVPTRPAAQIGG